MYYDPKDAEKPAKTRFFVTTLETVIDMVQPLPRDAFCTSCVVRSSPTDINVLIDLECTCAGTLREPMPFSEVWGR